MSTATGGFGRAEGTLPLSTVEAKKKVVMGYESGLCPGKDIHLGLRFKDQPATGIDGRDGVTAGSAGSAFAVCTGSAGIIPLRVAAIWARMPSKLRVTSARGMRWRSNSRNLSTTFTAFWALRSGSAAR